MYSYVYTVKAPNFDNDSYLRKGVLKIFKKTVGLIVQESSLKSF